MSLVNSFPIREVDYSHKTQAVKSSYKYSKIIQQTGGTTATISTAPVETIFELPPRVMNLSKSYLNATATVTAQGATGWAWMFADKPPIQNVSLYTRGGIFLCDVSNAQEYLKVRLKEEERDKYDYFHADALSFNHKNTEAVRANYRHNNSSSSLDCDPQYFVISSENTDLTLKMSIPLSLIKDTLLACNKNFYFNEVLLLKITWAKNTEWGAKATSATDPTAAGSGGPTALTGNIDITNMYLYLALEEDPILANQLVNQVATGSMSVIVPWVYSFKNVPGSGGAAGAIQTVSVRLNQAMGNHLKKMYHAFYPATRTIFAQFNIDNTNKTQVVHYHTKLDNMRRSDFNITSADGDDYLMRRDALKDTFLESLSSFRYNWFVVDDYDLKDDVPDKMCVASGLPLGVEHKWDIEASCANEAFNHYSFAVVSRVLTISNMGIMIQ